MRGKTSSAFFLTIALVLVLGSLAAQAMPTETPVLSLPHKPHYVFQRVGGKLWPKFFDPVLHSARPGQLHLDRDSQRASSFRWQSRRALWHRTGPCQHQREPARPGSHGTNIGLSPRAASLTWKAARSTNCPFPRFTIFSGSLLYLPSILGARSISRPKVACCESIRPAPTISASGLLPMACRARKRRRSTLPPKGAFGSPPVTGVGWLDSQDHVHMFPPQSGLPARTCNQHSRGF